MLNKIKAGAKKALEESNNEDKPLTEFDYLKRNIEEIESYDIEVKIEPQEIRTALKRNEDDLLEKIKLHNALNATNEVK